MIPALARQQARSVGKIQLASRGGAACPEVLISAEQIEEQVRSLAAQLDVTYRDSTDLVLVGVLRGAVYFLSDLSRAMVTPHRLDFVELASYQGTQRGPSRLIRPCTDRCTDADVVLVDEVFDSGETICAFAMRFCDTSRAHSPHACCSGRRE